MLIRPNFWGCTPRAASREAPGYSRVTRQAAEASEVVLRLYGERLSVSRVQAEVAEEDCGGRQRPSVLFLDRIVGHYRYTTSISGRAAGVSRTRSARAMLIAPAIAITVKIPGSETRPVSTARIVPIESPAASASCCWLRPNFVRRLRIVAERNAESSANLGVKREGRAGTRKLYASNSAIVIALCQSEGVV